MASRLSVLAALSLTLLPLLSHSALGQTARPDQQSEAVAAHGAANPPPGATVTAADSSIASLDDAIKGSGRLMLPKDAIQLRNSSGASLIFYVRDVARAAGWQLVRMGPKTEAVLRLSSVWIAVGTSVGGAQLKPIADAPFSKLKGDGDQFDGYAIRQLRQTRRYEICWTDSKKAWSIYDMREYACQ